MGSASPTHSSARAHRPDLAAARIAAGQQSVISTRQLAGCGLNSGAITTRVRRGNLRRLYRGVYAVGSAPLTLKARLVAAVLACGADAILSHFAAAAWWGFVVWDDRRVDVTVPRAAGRRVPAIRSRRPRALGPRDAWRRDGIHITSPARTVLDLAAELPAAALRRMVRQALTERRLSIGDLAAVIERSTGHPGTAAVQVLITDGHVPTRSELEDRALDVLERAGIERPEVNAKLVLGQRALEPDLLWRRQRLVVELDGAAWHDNRLTREDDAARQALLEAHGYRVVRITWRQLADAPAQTLARIRAALGEQPTGIGVSNAG